MRTASPIAVIALYAVASVAVMALVLEAMFWWSRMRRPGGRITTDEYDIDALRRHARARRDEMAAAKEAGR